MASTSSSRAGFCRLLLASALLTCCLVEAAEATSVFPPGRIARRLLQSDPSVCPSELGFTACFVADGSSFNCTLDSCDNPVSIPTSGFPRFQPQAVRSAGTVLVDFFTAIGNNDYSLYQGAVLPYSTYYPNYNGDSNAPSVDGQTLSVFNALRATLNVPPGADYRSIFKVTDVSIGISSGAVVGVGFTVSYPSSNPTLTLHFSLSGTAVTPATPSGWSISLFYYIPYGAR